MWTRNMIAAILVVVLAWAGPVVASAVIDFETVPGGTPSPGLAISDQYLITCGISFSLGDGTYPSLGQYGPPKEGWVGPGGDDTLAAGYDGFGEFFLTYLNNTPLRIDFARPVQVAGAEIIDIDNLEQWTVEAYGESDNLLDSLTLPDGVVQTGNGVPTPFEFHGLGPIAYITMTPNSGGGFGIDNVICPEPATLSLAAIGGVALLRRRR